MSNREKLTDGKRNDCQECIHYADASECPCCYDFDKFKPLQRTF